MDDANTNAMTLTAALEAGEIPYAIGGALAFGAWAAPRGTHDVDLDVFLDGSEAEHVLDLLGAVGLEFDRPEARLRAAEGAVVAAYLRGMRVDLFFASIAFCWEAARTRVRIETPVGPRWYLSAEAIAIFKLLFFRAKDQVDLDVLLRVHRALDRAYIRRWTVEMMGEDDERVVAWDRLCAGAPA
jgi:hypothetical protein